MDIPGVGQKQIRHVVFDYNGTIAKDGILIPGMPFFSMTGLNAI